MKVRIASAFLYFVHLSEDRLSEVCNSFYLIILSYLNTIQFHQSLGHSLPWCGVLEEVLEPSDDATDGHWLLGVAKRFPHDGSYSVVKSMIFYNLFRGCESLVLPAHLFLIILNTDLPCHQDTFKSTEVLLLRPGSPCRISNHALVVRYTR